MYETHWGLPVISYLFLAGLGAGALTVSASLLLRGGSGGRHFQIARFGALLAPLPLIIGTAMIVLELGTFQVAIENGEFLKLFRWINLFLTVNLSPMNIGSWALALCIIISVLYAYTFLAPGSAPEDDKAGLRRKLAWVSVPLGIAVAVYTGVLLGAMPSRPFWNTPVLALLFLVSALSTGVAGILILKALFGHGASAEAEIALDKGEYLLTSSDLLLLGFEVLAIFLFLMFAHLTIGAPAEAVAVILPGGSLALAFWGGVVVLGLLLPALIELKYVLPTLLHKKPFAIPRGMEVLVSVIILIGGFLLRYVVVIAGQITGPVGI
jgi:formate-dependent nitrite reductase membrane component NrfD